MKTFLGWRVYGGVKVVVLGDIRGQRALSVRLDLSWPGRLLDGREWSEFPAVEVAR